MGLCLLELFNGAFLSASQALMGLCLLAKLLMGLCLLEPLDDQYYF